LDKFSNKTSVHLLFCEDFDYHIIFYGCADLPMS